jgi:hypothetical protein
MNVRGQNNLPIAETETTVSSSQRERDQELEQEQQNESRENTTENNTNLTKRCYFKFVFTAETTEYDVPTSWTSNDFIQNLTPIVKNDAVFRTIRENVNRDIEFVPLKKRESEGRSEDDEAMRSSTDESWYNPQAHFCFYYIRFVE